MSNQGPYGPPPGQYQGPPPQQYGPPPGGPQYWGPPQGPPMGPPPMGPPPMGPPMGPPQGPGFGWGSNGFPPPPRKKSKAAWIILPVVIIGLAVVGFGVLSAILKHNGDNDYTSPQPTSTATDDPTAEPTYIQTSATIPTQAPPPPATTQRVTQPPATTRTTPTTPPPSDNYIVTKNRIYKTGVQTTVNCRESGARPTTVANARKYYASILNCLVRAWPKQVTLAGGRFVAPRLVAFSGSATSPCMGNSPSSFYCSANRTIYMDAQTDVNFYRQYGNIGYQNAWIRADMSDTMAHEFGHHIQYMTGILGAQQNLQYQSNSTKALEIARRKEIQATCFGNVFLGANKGPYRISGELKRQLDWLHSHQGDEYGTQRDHGSRAIIPRWANAGFATRNPGSCNTFVAAATYVR